MSQLIHVNSLYIAIEFLGDKYTNISSQTCNFHFHMKSVVNIAECNSNSDAVTCTCNITSHMH